MTWPFCRHFVLKDRNCPYCIDLECAAREEKRVQEHVERQLRERKLAEFFDLYPEYKGREEEVIKIIDRYY